GVDAEHLDAEVLAAVHHPLDRPHAGPVAERVGPVALAGPPAVAVHDDADVARRRRLAGQHRYGGRRRLGIHRYLFFSPGHTSITSASLRWAMASILPVWASVIFWSWSPARLAWSSGTSPARSRWWSCCSSS